MNLLIIAATAPETAILRELLKLKKKTTHHWTGVSGPYNLQLVHTGVGMVNTAYALGELLAVSHVDKAINLGIAGSFDREIELGTVVEVVADTFSELGAQAGLDFLDMKALGFPVLEDQASPLFNTLSNPQPAALGPLPVSGITVNTVHGHEPSIVQTLERWHPKIETMEGAAFFHAMLKKKIPFMAFRGISNVVEHRNRNNWKIGLAAQNVQTFRT